MIEANIPPSLITEAAERAEELPEHVLVVDDEPVLATSLADVLELDGYETLVALNGKEALELVGNHSVSVALLDINLPDITGTELLQEIKRISPTTSVIMTTADKSVDLVVEAVNLGASGYFHKPVEPIPLLAAVRDKMEKQRLARENLHLVRMLSEMNDKQKTTINHLNRLQDLSRTVSSTLELDEVLLAVRSAVIDALGFDRCSIYLVDPVTREIQGRWGTGRNGEIVDISGIVQSSHGEYPIAKVARGDSKYFRTDDWEAYVKEHFGEHPNEDLVGVGAHAILPLKAMDHIVGILSVDNLVSEKPITENDIEQILPFTYQAAIAIENAELYKKAQETARSEAEKAAELELLWLVSQAVTSELDLDSVLDAVSKSVCTAMTTKYVSLMLINNRTREIEARSGQGLSQDEALHSLFMSGESAVGTAVMSGRAQIVNCLGDIKDNPLGDLARKEGLQSMLCVPLRVGDDSIGVLTVYSQMEGRFKDNDLRLLTTLASIASAAIHNALFYDRERQIAQTLQHELLTVPPEEINDFQIGHYYQPALEEARIGGDFFDVVELPDGRIAILMADVSGKGLKAAVYTAMGKYMFRGLLVDDPSPGHLVERLNAALCRYTEPGLFITLFYGLLDPETGLLRYANAGHESPLHYIAEHEIVMPLDTTGVVLGVDPDAVYAEHETCLNGKDALLLYTDGVTDARPEVEGEEDDGASVIEHYHERIRQGEEMLGMEGLQEMLIETIKQNPSSLVGAIYKKVFDFASGMLHDDIALLAIQAPDRS